MKLWLTVNFKRLTGVSKLRSLIVYLLFISGVIWWQHSDMLTTGESVTLDKLQLLTVEGSVYQYELNNGKDDLLIYFFAPWCHICHASIDSIEAVKRSNPEAINFIVVALDWNSVSEVDEFLSQHQLSMPVLLGTRDIQQQFQITAFPSYYLIDKNGLILARNKGYSTEWGMKLSVFSSRLGDNFPSVVGLYLFCFIA